MTDIVVWSPEAEGGGADDILTDVLPPHLQALHASMKAGDRGSYRAAMQEMEDISNVLTAWAASDAEFDMTGQLVTAFGSCLSGVIDEGTVCYVANEPVYPSDAALVLLKGDLQPTMVKIYLGSCLHDDVDHVAVWMAKPETVLLVPKSQVLGMWPVRQVWSQAEGWRLFLTGENNPNVGPLRVRKAVYFPLIRFQSTKSQYRVQSGSDAFWRHQNTTYNRAERDYM